LGNELFAIDDCMDAGGRATQDAKADGRKMSSDASKEWSGTHKELKEKRDKLKRLIRHHMDKHQQCDQSNEADQEKQQRLQQQIDTLDANCKKIDEFLENSEPRIGEGKKKEVKSNITDNESAKMTTSKGTIQGYNGIASVDKKHQIIIDAQAFGSGQEHHVLKPVLENVKKTYQDLGISDDIYKDGTIVTADTGYANEANMEYLYNQAIDAYIPDNQFRSRDPKFAKQKEKHGKRNQHVKKKKDTQLIPASEFQLNLVDKTCVCPVGEVMWLKNNREDQYGNQKLFFEGRLSKCRNCERKTRCMKNPASADTRNGHGRQVSFIIEKSNKKPNYTDWMKNRVDSEKGKLIYSHRMSVVEPVFGNIGSNKGLNRFSLRSKKKVQAQWQLYCMIQNIEKLKNYGELSVKTTK